MNERMAMKPFLWALAAAVVWGCVPVIEKIGLSKMPVVPGLFYRCIGVIIGAGILLIFRAPQIRAALTSSPAGVPYVVIGGFLASVVGQLCFYHALKTGQASQVVPLAAAYPLISFILGVLFLHENMTAIKVGGLACIILGTILLR